MLMHVDLDIHQDLISHNLKVRLRAKAVAQQHVQVAIAALYMCMGNYASVCNGAGVRVHYGSEFT